jgi:hypothetical protein
MHNSGHVIGVFSQSTLDYIQSVSRYPLWARADIVNALKAGKISVEIIDDTKRLADDLADYIKHVEVNVTGFSDDSIRSVTILSGVEKFMLCKFYMRNQPDSDQKTMYIA